MLLNRIKVLLGISNNDNEELLNEIRDRRVIVECCPASNLKLGTVESYGSHPIRKLFDMGVPVCVCTDRLRVSGINLVKEYKNLARYLNFTPKELYKMNINAIQGAFLNQMEKDNLLFKLYEINKEVIDKE